MLGFALVVLITIVYVVPFVCIWATLIDQVFFVRGSDTPFLVVFFGVIASFIPGINLVLTHLIWEEVPIAHKWPEQFGDWFMSENRWFNKPMLEDWKERRYQKRLAKKGK